MENDLLSQLNDEQRAAAACTEGPVMIIAGAGSGKTRTLTYRIAHLIELGVDPFNILALTFTNKAAGEMKDRIIKLVGHEARNIWMGTFHSVFARILRSEADKLGYIKTFTIYDNDDSKGAIKQIIKQLQLDPKTYSPNYVLSRISMAKSNLIDPTTYKRDPEIRQIDDSSRKPLMGEIYTLYNARLRNAMAMDFDDLLFNTNVLLRDFPDVLMKYQNRFRYILVDEYQDTNYAQYLIVKKLAARFQNICVVGDDAQSIYAFRGANIQNIFNFKKDYPNVQLFKLEQNYRSTKNIVNAANSIITNNKEQIPKEIWTANETGNPISLMTCSDERDEGRRVAEYILEHKDEMVEEELMKSPGSAKASKEIPIWKNFAILYRNNVQSRAIEEALRRQNIPYHIYAGISFYGRKVVKDVLAYLRLVVNNHDDESMVRVINYPSRGIGQTTLDKVRLAAADNDVSICTVLENLDAFSLNLNTSTRQKLERFLTMIKMFTAMVYGTDAYTLAKKVVYASGIVKALQEDDDPENPNKLENIEELLNGIKDFVESEDTITPEMKDHEDVANALNNDNTSLRPGNPTTGETLLSDPASLRSTQTDAAAREGITDDSPLSSYSVGEDGKIYFSNPRIDEGEPTDNPRNKTLDLFLQQVLLLTSEDKEKDKDADRVSLMTIHAAKGLEYPYVFVVGLEENLFPSIMSVTSRVELEEERRLFYVAVTRTEKQLILSHALTRYQYGQMSCQELSRFVEEIDPRYIIMPKRRSAFPKPGEMSFNGFANKPVADASGPFGRKKTFPGKDNGAGTSSNVSDASGNSTLKGAAPLRRKGLNTANAPAAGNTPAQIAAIQPGIMVHHAKFGVGEVKKVEGSGDSTQAVVFFQSTGEKKLVLKFAKLTVINN